MESKPCNSSPVILDIAIYKGTSRLRPEAQGVILAVGGRREEYSRLREKYVARDRLVYWGH